MRNLAIAGLLATSAMGAIQPAAAQSVNDRVEEYNFRVPAGRLPDVVSQIAAQARASVTMERSATSDIEVQGINGPFSLRDALAQVLSGTDFRIETGAGRKIRIVSSKGDADGTIVVIARRQDFARTNSSLLTRTDTSLRQTPGTVDSVTEEVMESQNAISVFEALRNIPGAIFSSSNGGYVAQIGQQDTGELAYVNGLQSSTIARDVPITDIDAIEVLKGPAAILQGAALVGGVINYVPKRATGRQGGDVTLGIGSGTEFMAVADVGGAILREQGLYWRVAAISQYARHIPGGGNDAHQYAINPMIGYRGDNVRFDVTFQYYDKRSPLRSTEAYDPTTGQFLPYGSRINPNAGSATESYRGSYNLEVDLLSTDRFSLTLRNRGLYQEAKRTGQVQYAAVYEFLGLGSAILNLASQDRDKQFSDYVDLYAKFATGPVEHQMIFAVDMVRSDTRRAPSVLDQGFVTGSGPAMPLLALPDMSQATLSKTRQYGIIFQDQMTLGRLHALVGLRETFYTSKPFAPNSAGQLVAGKSVARANKLSVNGGLVFDIAPTISVYGSYSTAFTPPRADSFTIDNQLLPPTTREQYEIGVKAGLLGDRLTVNLSGSTFTTDNSAEPDPRDIRFLRTAPGLKGKQFEASVSGSLTPSLKLLAGYTYADTERPTTTQPLLGAPQHVANLWAIQTFKIAKDQAINIGLGGNYNSGFYALDFLYGGAYYISRENIVANGSLSYTIGTVTLNAVVNNILDRRNYRPTSYISFPEVDTPRSFRVTLKAGF